MIQATPRLRDAADLPSALQKQDELRQKLQGKTLAVFLDYDGCLSPIVPDPTQAILSDQMREALQRLAGTCKVAVVSGRDRQDVERLVQMDSLYFAGSHGFDITGPGGMRAEPGGATEALAALDQAERELQERLQAVPGALVERKRYAIAVHYRNVTQERVAEVKQAVTEVLALHSELKEGRGKKIRELRPNIDWHKGHAVRWLLTELGLDTPDVVPLYIGDDITDEDAFAALQGHGITVMVGEHTDQTAAEYRLENVEEVQAFLQQLRRLAKPK